MKDQPVTPVPPDPDKAINRVPDLADQGYYGKKDVPVNPPEDLPSNITREQARDPNDGDELVGQSQR
jgi:hypothetical protein